MQLKARESQIQKSILDYLQIRGYFVWRNNTGGFEKVYNGKSHFIRAGFKGSGDIIGMTKKGTFLSIEVKRPGEKATPDQQRFMDRTNENGGMAFVAHDLGQVVDKGF